MTLDEVFIALKSHYISKDFIETNEFMTKESRHFFFSTSRTGQLLPHLSETA